MAGLILAAGKSQRMGRSKALLPFRDSTFVGHLAQLFARYCEEVIVVLGYDPQPIRDSLDSAVKVAVNSNYEAGQLSSLQCGLRETHAGIDRVLFTLVDHPNPSPNTIERLLSSEAVLTIPVYLGRRGHPILFDRELIPEFLDLPSDSQARFVIRRHAGAAREIEVDDPGILDDIDDPEALRVFRERTA